MSNAESKETEYHDVALVGKKAENAKDRRNSLNKLLLDNPDLDIGILERVDDGKFHYWKVRRWKKAQLLP